MISPLIAADMAQLTARLQAIAQNADHWLPQVTQQSLQDPGKQLRPQLVLLTAGMCGKITLQARRGALLVSLLHQASLLHDDVLDKATQRRGKPSTNATWGNSVAVLLGDYLLTQAWQLALQHQDYHMLALMTEAAQAMSEGELLQLAQTQQPSTTEEIYLTIIHKKTAYLFGTCMLLGTMAAGAPATQQARMRQVGEQLGLAFQLQDDWLDYGTTDVGKPLGLDLQRGQWTLPLIHALQVATAQERKDMLWAMRHQQDDPGVQRQVRHFVSHSAGMDYTLQRIAYYQQQALQSLSSMPPSPHKKALLDLIQAIFAHVTAI